MCAEIQIVDPIVTTLQDMPPIRKLEYAYRTCYQSRDKIGPESYKLITSLLYPDGGGTPHTSPLEHVAVNISVYAGNISEMISELRNWQHQHYNYNIRVVSVNVGYCYLHGNLRAFFEFWSEYSADLCLHLPALYYLMYAVNRSICSVFPIFRELGRPKDAFKVLTAEPSCEVSGNVTSFNIVTSRDILQELVRHRSCSFSVESTRYCNYKKKGFSFVRPLPFQWAGGSEATHMYQLWYDSCKDSADTYLKMLDAGATPEEARMVLPGGLKTELVMSSTRTGWNHFLALRDHPTAHPQIQLIAKEIKKYVS